MTKGDILHSRGGDGYVSKNSLSGEYGEFRSPAEESYMKYPKSILSFEKEHKDFYHPSQKPVPLLEYLIMTYTDEGSVVLDNCMGSGSTGIACVNTGRSFVGMELDDTYYDIAEKRVYKWKQQKDIL